MEAKCPPGPPDVLPQLAGLLRLIHDALAFGTDAAVKYHEDHRRLQIDPWLFSHIARDNAKYYMGDGGLKALGFEIAPLAMSGLYLHNEHLGICILRVGYLLDKETGEFESGVPSPASRLRREYFYQPALSPSLALMSPSDDMEIEQRLKLVVLWDRDEAHQLGAFELACPKYYNASRNCVDTWWIVPVDVEADDLGASFVRADEPILLPDLDIPERSDEEQATGDDRSR